MVYSSEYKVATKWLIKKETFMNVIDNVICCEDILTTIPGYKYYFAMEVRHGDVAICFCDNCGTCNTKVKEMTLSIASADFKCDLSKSADVPNDIYFNGIYSTVVIKLNKIVDPEKKFFVDNILTLKFNGTIEHGKEPESLAHSLFYATDKDFTFVAENLKVQAHKFILGRYSFAFRKMFKFNVDELKIHDFCFLTVYSVLEFCYDLSVYNPYYELLECLRFANVYDMPDIKERITNKLSERINIKNVAEIANKSLKYNSPTLKGYCINFISKCIKDGETYDDAINLNQKIVQELYTTSLCHTVIS